MNRPPATQSIGSPTLHATIVFSIAVFVAILIMSYLFKVEIVAKGIGKVVPLGRVQVVQPEFGGQIKAIHVQNGMRVNQGDVVIELDRTNAQSELNTLAAEKVRIDIERGRIEAVVSSLADLYLDDEVISTLVATFEAQGPTSQERFLNEQADLLFAELTELRDALRQVDGQITANAKSKAITQASIERVEIALITQQERLETASNLLERGATSRASYLDVLDGFNRLEKDRDLFLRELDQKAALDFLHNAERAGIVSSLRSRLQTRRTELEARATSLSEEIITAERQLRLTHLTAPIAGVVDQLAVFTIGGVVNAGQELVRIVPEDQKMEIEAMLPNSDIGFLELGQIANIKLDAYPAERFGALRGAVTNVSADAVEIGENTFGFVVRIAPEKPYLLSGDDRLSIQPGMTSVVDVITGKRRLISYFFAPIVKVVSESMGER